MMKYTDVIPFGNWLPDMPSLGAGLDLCSNVYSQGTSYIPFPGPEWSDSTVAARPFGAASFKDSSGNSHTFVGTSTKLYKLQSDGTYDDVTRTSGGDYSTPSDGFWRFSQYGNRIIAVNGASGDEVQTYVLGSSTDFANLNATDTPKARTTAVINNFVFVANTENAPNEVAWSGLDAPTSWAASATTQADKQQIENEGGAIQALVGFQNTGIILQEKAIVRVQYVGPPLIFEFIDAVRGVGAKVTGSVVSHKGVIYFLDEDGFYMFDGTQVRAIGDKRIDRYFWDNVNQNFLDRITSVIDPINKLVLWSFPDVDSDGTPNRIIIYNYEDDRWSLAGVSHELLFSALSSDVDLDSLDAIYGDLDSIPYSLDSRAFIGGGLLVGAFNNASFELGYLTGLPLTVNMESKFSQLNPRGRAYIDGVQILSDCALTGVQVRVLSANRHDQFVSATGAALATPNTASQFVDMSADGRYQKVFVQLADDSMTEISGFRMRWKESSDI